MSTFTPPPGAPTVTDADSAAESRARTCVLLSTVPLALVVASFFLPVLAIPKSTARPWLDVVPGSLILLVPWPTYGVALFFAVLFIVAAIRRSAPGDASQGLARIGLIACMLWALPFAAFMAFGLAAQGSSLLAPLGLALLAPALWAFRRAAKHVGWSRWGYFLLAYALTSLPLVLLLLASMGTDAYGAWLAIPAFGTILVLALVAVMRSWSEDT